MWKVYGTVLLMGVILAPVAGQGVVSDAQRYRIGSEDQIAYNPILSADDKTLFVTVSRNPSNTGLSDLDDVWMAFQSENGGFSRPLLVGSPLDNEQHNQAISLSLDGNTLYIWNHDGEDGRGVLARARRDGRNWREPEPIKIDGWDTLQPVIRHWYVSLQEDFMLLSALMPGSSGKEDLYVSFRKAADRWSVPRPLGLGINSNYRESSVYLAADQHTLYFASDRPGGFGGLDLYVSRRLDESWTSWTAPVNLGSLINSPDDESQACVAHSNETIYFTVGTPREDAGVYSAPLAPEYQPTAMFLMEGQVRQAITNTPLSADICVYGIRQGEAVSLYCGIRTDAAGRFLLLVPQMQNIGVYAREKGFLSPGYYIVPGGMREEKEDEERELVSEIIRKEPTYRQREADIEGLQGKIRQLRALRQEMDALRTAERGHIETVLATPLPRDESMGGKYPQAQLRSRYEATREQYIRNWTIDQDYAHLGDADTDDFYTLPGTTMVQRYPTSAEGRIQELRDRKEQQQERANGLSASGEALGVPPANFEDFKAAMKDYLALQMRDSLLDVVERTLSTQTIGSLRGALSESYQEVFQVVVDRYLRSMKDPAANRLSLVGRQTPTLPIQQYWQRAFADSLASWLFPEVENYLHSKLKNPVRAYQEHVLLMNMYQEQEIRLETDLGQLIQKQVQVEKNYRRKASGSFNTGIEYTTDTLTVYSNRTTSLDVWMYPVNSPVQLRMDNILFKPNQSEIEGVSQVELHRLADFLLKNPQVHATLDIHTNGQCSYSFAQEITQERAWCLADYLIFQEGVPKTQLLVRARGKDAPLAGNDSREGRLENQRIEVLLVPATQQQ